MALGVYGQADPSGLLTTLKPFVITFDGRIGGTISRKVYVRNDDPDRWYTDIRIQAVDTSGTNIVDGSVKDFFWKFQEKDINPTPEEWDLVSPGNQITLNATLGNNLLGDIVTYIPVWIRIRVPRGLDLQTIKDVVLRVDATENVTVNG